MRDLKTLLELLLEEWEKTKLPGNRNACSGLCSVLPDLLFNYKITKEESIFLRNYLMKGVRNKGRLMFIFDPRLHNERVEWLKERIKELEK